MHLEIRREIKNKRGWEIEDLKYWKIVNDYIEYIYILFVLWLSIFFSHLPFKFVSSPLMLHLNIQLRHGSPKQVRPHLSSPHPKVSDKCSFLWQIKWETMMERGKWNQCFWHALIWIFCCTKCQKDKNRGGWGHRQRSTWSYLVIGALFSVSCVNSGLSMVRTDLLTTGLNHVSQ